MNKKRFEVIGLAIVIGFIFLFSLVYNLQPGITGFAVYSQSGDDFSEGSFDNTELSSNLISLISGSSSGSYTSSIFNAGSAVSWNNISWVTSGISGIELPNDNGNEGEEGVDMSDNFLLLHLNSDYSDSSGSGNDGSAVGSLSFSGGVYRDAVVIDGSDKYVSVPSEGLSFVNSYSLEFWVKPSSSASQWRTMVEKSSHFTIDLISSDKVRVQGTGYPTLDSSVGIARNEWSHIVFTLYDTPTGNDVLKLYINGQERGSIGPAWGTPGSSTSDLRIGGVGGTDYVDGMYDEFAGYSRVLSAEEVLARYNRGIARLDAFVRSCDDSACSGESWIDIEDSSPQDLSVDDNQYFQYRFDFSGSDTNPKLESVDIDYSILNSAPVIEIVSPIQSQSFNSPADVSLNYSVFDEDDNLESCWYVLNSGSEILIPNCENITLSGLTTNDYSLVIYANDSNGAESSDSVLFSVVNSAPSVSIISPVVGEYVYGTEIELEYNVLDLEGNLESCWYNIGSENMSLVDCSNVSLGGLATNSYNLVVYANDSEGLIGSDSVSFEIVNGAPSIEIINPVTQLYISGLIELDYNVLDLEGNLESCWYNIGSENVSLEGCDNTTLDLEDGFYELNIYANDSEGLIGSDSVSFSVDAAGISIEIVEPTGVKKTRNNLPLNYNVQGVDLSCWYSVFRGSSVEIVNTSLSDCGNSSFNVTVDADFVLRLYANNTYGSVVSDSVSFSVDTSVVSSEPAPSSSGGSGYLVSFGGLNLEVRDLGDIIFTKPESKTLELSVKNRASTSYNKCRLIGEGIKSDVIRNINGGEIVEFIFELSPESNGTVSIECVEGKKNINLSLYVIESNYIAGINGIELKKDMISVGYVIESDFDSSGLFIFSLLNDKGSFIGSREVELNLIRGENSGVVDFETNERGMLRVVISEGDAILVEENFISDSQGITGRAITDVLDGNGVWMGVIALVFIVFAFFIIRNILRHKKRGRVRGRK